MPKSDLDELFSPETSVKVYQFGHSLTVSGQTLLESLIDGRFVQPGLLPGFIIHYIIHMYVCMYKYAPPWDSFHARSTLLRTKYFPPGRDINSTATVYVQN